MYVYVELATCWLGFVWHKLNFNQITELNNTVLSHFPLLSSYAKEKHHLQYDRTVLLYNSD